MTRPWRQLPERAVPAGKGRVPSRSAAVGLASERVALKDEHLVYRACSRAFARSLGAASPEDIIGKTDFDLLPKAVAREQMALDSRTMYLAQPDIATIELRGRGGASRRVMIVRTPVTSSGRQVRGIDIRLLGKGDASPSVVNGMGDVHPDPSRERIAGVPAGGEPAESEPVDDGSAEADPATLVALVDDGIQGSLIFAGETVLFANDNAASVLGFAGADSLIGGRRVSELFEPEQLSLVAEKATEARERAAAGRSADGKGGRRSAGRLTLTARTCDARAVRLIARAAEVDWGARRATLLSFVDVALMSSEIPDLGAITGSIPVPHAGPEALVTRVPSTPARPDDPSLTLLHDGDPAEDSPGGSGAAGRDPFRSDSGGGDLVPGDPAVNLRRLRADEQRFRHYASSAADFFWELDANLVFRVVSDDIEKVLGLSMDQLVGRTHRQLSGRLADASDPDHWQRHLDSLERHEQFRDFEFRCSVDGGMRVIRYSGLPLFDRQGRFVGYRGVGGDVTASVRQAEVLAYHASHDGLTGLINRRRFEKTLENALETSPLRRESHALCFMDLDRFKVVNDTCGHPAGDELLRQLARLLNSLVRKSDVLARLGGDEFGVFLYRCDMAGALKLANQIRSEVERFEFLWEGKRFTIGVSLGLVVVDDRWKSVDSLFSAADSACYIAKNEGRNRVVVYREAEGRASNRKVATHWVDEIDSALAADRLHIACQPIRSLGSHGEGEGEEGARLEVLIRLRLPGGELVSPRAFLPAAERHGLSAALDERAVSLTLDWLTAFPDRLSDIRHVSINLASGSFTDEGFAERLIALLEGSDVATEKLCFELSETAAIAHLAKASDFMRRLAAIGCRFGIDDFGSSLSSFTWMRALPIDFVKIDGRLVKNILDDPVDLTTVRAIGDISRSMGTRTVAEFVESSELLEALRTIGIDFAQGYHIGRPELVERPERQPAH